ncbi:VWA domain-containing protein [Camelimonas abortus]|uniref:VWA domain-containing protein n=1 Tax=Camelimonas abortus TaxID=1017184 RepID=A0ABV7LCT7_9HYPH
MTQVLGEFIRALREADVRISPAEVIDAEAVLALVGYENRTLLAHGLSQALAKSDADKAAFWDVFDRFFAFAPFSERPAAEQAGPDGGDDQERREADGAADAPRDEAAVTGMASAGGEGQGSGAASGKGDGALKGKGDAGAGAPGEAAAAPVTGPHGETLTAAEELARLLERGDSASLALRVAEAAQQAGLSDIRFFTQRGMYQWRILQLMGSEELGRWIDQAEHGSNAAAAARAARLRGLRAALHDQVRDYVETQLQLFAGNEGRRLREDMLASQRIGQLDRSDMQIMQGLVRKMAKRLISLHSRRRRKARRGVLDARRTIRANMQYEGVPFHTIWRRTKVDRPKVMLVCDVSGSVAQVSRFLLLFMHSLHEVLPEVRSFAFSSNLGEVTELFGNYPPDVAMGRTLQRFGGSTDYGHALSDFARLALDDVDRRTTVIILGDARNNNGDPRAHILQAIQQRAKQVLFLNPEHRSRWGTGDSVMPVYAAYCNRVISCGSLKELERVVSDLLRTAA